MRGSPFRIHISNDVMIIDSSKRDIYDLKITAKYFRIHPQLINHSF